MTKKKDANKPEPIIIRMPEEESSVRSQLKSLFSKTDKFEKRVTMLEAITVQHEKQVDAINTLTKELHDSNKKHGQALFGDKDQGIEGLVASNKKQDKTIGGIEKWVGRVIVGSVVALYFIKELGVFDKAVV